MRTSILDGAQTLCVIARTAVRMHVWSLSENSLSMAACVFQLGDDAAASPALLSTHFAFHGLHFCPRQRFSTPQQFPSLSQRCTDVVATCGSICVWHPRAWIACGQSVREAIHFPGFSSQAVCMQHGEVPFVFGALCFGEFKQSVNGIFVFGVVAFPEHSHHALLASVISTPILFAQVVTGGNWSRSPAKAILMPPNDLGSRLRFPSRKAHG